MKFKVGDEVECLIGWRDDEENILHLIEGQFYIVTRVYEGNGNIMVRDESGSDCLWESKRFKLANKTITSHMPVWF